MKINENWAVSHERIAEFFLQQQDVSGGDGILKYHDSVITLTADRGSIGSIEIPRTQVTIEGPEEQVNEIYKRFFLRFLSAGG